MPDMTRVIGVGGVRSNAAAALCDHGRIVGFCEEERLSRIKGIGFDRGQPPSLSLAYLATLGDEPGRDYTLAAAEEGVDLPPDGVRIDHHAGHAATAVAFSTFADAAVLVCDSHRGRNVSLWNADSSGVTDMGLAWTGPGPASVYTGATEALGYVPRHGEHRVEALARLGKVAAPRDWPELFTFHGDHLEVHQDFTARIHDAAGRPEDIVRRSRVAADVQAAIGAALLQLVSEAKRRTQSDTLCLAGGLFYNSYFATLVACSGIFAHVVVPANPGNAGTAIGAAIEARGRPLPPHERQPSAFLGPEFDNESIKEVLDNCKLSYEFRRDGAVLDLAVEALISGQLVGWFQGRMECGARALGHRSIVANPFSPYTLENINRFLKRREPYRPYSVSVLASRASALLEGPPASPFMEYEFEVRDPDRFQSILPGHGRTLRAHTVADERSLFGQLLSRFGQATGVAALVNTSFNGFHEPIVCTPRDAVRVFFGTGLDVAVIGNFVLRK
jgi:carbamoyltransferase